MTKLLFETNICPFLPKLYGIYKSVEDIVFDTLPQSFVLKTNHDCGGVVIVPDKEAFLRDSKKFSEAMEKLTKHLNTNFYTLYREYHYKDIEPRIFAEELLGERTQAPQFPSPDSKKIEKSDFHKFFLPLCDYRFHCFNAHIGFIQVANPTHTHNNLFTSHWQPLPIAYLNTPSTQSIPKPHKLDSMLEVARHLSSMIDYVRIDLYYIVGERVSRIYVGELTLTPNGGSARFDPELWDREFGTLWNLTHTDTKTNKNNHNPTPKHEIDS
ncbi:ATP-grasp fold amidoligase family protein [uncultured Helicobacter sp.]|uniref:ATP-grasp fold amidoligase family protein n=1 Tax=uncultured Helicobacter sp. TaxID=175537 RepID=UPI00374E6C53